METRTKRSDLAWCSKVSIYEAVSKSTRVTYTLSVILFCSDRHSKILPRMPKLIKINHSLRSSLAASMSMISTVL